MSKRTKPSVIKKRKQQKEAENLFRLPDCTVVSAIYTEADGDGSWSIEIRIPGESEPLRCESKSIHHGLRYLGKQWWKNEKRRGRDKESH